MAKRLQLRRGTTAEHSTFTGAVGEVTVDTDKDVVVVHDGSTDGGIPMARADALADAIATISGTYIPTATAGSNVDTTEAFISGYQKIGNIVTVNGTARINITALNTLTSILLSLPFASTFDGSQLCEGVMSYYSGNERVTGVISQNTFNNKAQITFESSFYTSNITVTFSFMYQIV